MELNHINKRILIDPLTIDDDRIDNFVLIGGFADFSSLDMIANSYKERADELAKIAVKNKDIAYEYTFPTIYLYRHALELYLKTLMPKNKFGHKFDSLINNINSIGKKYISDDVLKQLILRLNEFKELDNKSTRFRYGQELGEEFLINLQQLSLTFNEIILIIKELYRIVKC